MSFLEEHWALIMVIGSVVFILVYGLFRVLKGEEGSVSESIRADSSAAVNARPRLSDGERRTRAFLEARFGKPFPKARPDFLKNKVTQANLELDCYNDELRLAAEYNGRQHYEFVPYFHASKESFQNQKYRDEQKRAACAEHGITLLEVPYTEDARLEEWLEERLQTLGL